MKSYTKAIKDLEELKSDAEPGEAAIIEQVILLVKELSRVRKTVDSVKKRMG